MVQIQQISSWRSIFGSDMGDPMLPQLPGGFDETIPMTMIAQAKKLAFKKPFWLVKMFQVTLLAARGVSPAGSAASSMQLGITTAGYSQSRTPMHVESPSPGAMDQQGTGHQR